MSDADTLVRTLLVHPQWMRLAAYDSASVRTAVDPPCSQRVFILHPDKIATDDSVLQVPRN